MFCDFIDIGNPQQTFKEKLEGHLSYAQHIIKNGQKSDSSAAYYEQHFKYYTLRNDICTCITFKVVK